MPKDSHRKSAYQNFVYFFSTGLMKYEKINSKDTLVFNKPGIKNFISVVLAIFIGMSPFLLLVDYLITGKFNLFSISALQVIIVDIVFIYLLIRLKR